jgi:hypothetical protein
MDARTEEMSEYRRRDARNLKNVFQSSKAALPVLDDGGGVARRPAELLKLCLRDVTMNCGFVGFVSLLNDTRVARAKLVIEGFWFNAEHFVENRFTLRLMACCDAAGPASWNEVKQQEKREPPPPNMTLRRGALATEACILLALLLTCIDSCVQQEVWIVC